MAQYDINNHELLLYFSQAKDIFIKLSAQLNIEAINHAAETVFNIAENECIGKSYEVLFANDQFFSGLFQDPAGVFSLLKLHPNGVKVETSQGNIFIAWTIIGIKNNDAWESIILIGNNLTDLQIAKQKIRDTKISFETMIAHLPGNVYWMDTECRHIGCNNNVLKMLGLTREKYVGKTYEELATVSCWTQSDALAFKRDDLEVLRTGQPKCDVEEASITHVDGTQHCYLTSRVPMTNEKGDIIGVAGISTDITQRKMMENELLRQKIKAERAVESQNRFLANMTHDFITPLSIVMGAANALLTQGDDALKRREYCNDIVLTTSQLLGYVNDLLEVIKVETHEIPLKKTIFNLKNLIAELYKIFYVLADEKNIKLNLTYPIHTPDYIVSDAQRIRRILYNLLANAIKFTEYRGEVSLKVECETLANNYIGINFIVSDNGIGIPKDKFELIFDRFVRLNPSFSSTYKGVGIGLSIVKEFVRQLEGDIELTSHLGKGSTFTVKLKCKQPTETEIEAFKSNLGLADMTLQSINHYIPTHPENKQILIVEDEPVIQKFTQLMVSGFGFHTLLAKNADEAITLSMNNDLDLILLDIGLPEKDGLYVAKRIREYEEQTQKGHTNIIAVTAHTDVDKKNECLQAGVDDFIRKPLNKEIFMKICMKFSL